MQIAHNISKRTDKIRYIVLHDTGNTSKGADAAAHFAYFNGGNRNASADFFVDDKGVLSVNDYETYCTWHCGDGKGKKGITNQNSIGIEICVNRDGDYDKAVKNALRLTAFLMETLNIPAKNVVRHFDASGKLCPASMSKNDWQNWKVFKKALASDKDFVQRMAGLEEQTMAYLAGYTYKDALLQKLADTMRGGAMARCTRFF